MSEKKQADVQELVQELSQCNDVQSLQETARSMGKDLSAEDSRGLFDLLGTAATNQVFSSLVSGNQASSGLNLGTLLNFASAQAPQVQAQQNPLADGFQLTDLITFMQGSKPQQSSGLNLVDFATGIMCFAYAGMVGVFLTALFTKRGNTRSVVAALIIGALIILPLMFQEELFGKNYIAWTWWCPIGGIISTLVCMSGKPEKA